MTFKKIVSISLIILVKHWLYADNADSLKLLLKTNDKSQQLNVLLEIADYYTANYLDSSLSYCTQAFDLANTLNQPNEKAKALKLTGNVYFRKGQPEKTKEYYQQALSIFYDNGNFTETGNIYNNLGLLYQHLGKISLAEENLEKSLAIFNRQETNLLTTGPLINLGLLNFSIGDYTQAASYYTQALVIAKDYNDFKSIANITNNLGALYAEWGNFNKALEFYNESIKNRKEINDQLGIASNYSNIGAVFESLGDYATAIEYFNKSYELRKQLGIYEALGKSLNKLGDIYNAWGKYEIALEYYNETLIIEKKTKNKLNAANALAGMASVFYNTEMYNKALDLYNEAVSEYVQLGTKKELAIVNNHIGLIYLKKLNDYTQALKFFKLAEQICLDIDSEIDLATVYKSMGDLMLLQNNPKNAINLFEKSKKLHPQNKYHQYDCNLAIAQSYLLINNHTKANQYLNNAINIKDSILSDQRKLQTSRYETLIQNQKNQQQIELLKKENQIQNLELTKNKILIMITLISLVTLVFLLVFIIYLYQKIVKVNKKLNSQQGEITEQKNKLEDANASMLAAKIEAENHSKFKSEFLANVSHELRTPLNAITGYAKLIYNSQADSGNTHYLENIIQASDNLLVIINDLLDFSKIEAGKMVVNRSAFNPVKIATQTISTLRICAEEKNNDFEIHMDPNTPEFVIGDRNHLSQILTNLISNAIKFSPINKSITIDIQSNIEGNNCIISFSITDRGIGIEESQQELIFDSFTQAKNHDNKKYSGTGLGLSIVKRLVELQKGTITLKSKPNEGTTFTATLPYEIADKANIAPKDLASAPNVPIDKMRDIQVLLVEDNDINQELAKDTILSWGDNYHVNIVENGKEAITAIENNNYDVVLMDIQMPIMDGHEATLHIRNEMTEPKNKIPIIGMTAHAMNSEKELALNNGMNDYVIKPFNPDNLKQLINYFVYH